MDQLSPAPSLMLLNGAPGSGKSSLAGAVAADCGARFVEAALVLDEATLAERLSARRARPDRPEQRMNDRYVGPDDAGELIASIERVLRRRPCAQRLDARKGREVLVVELRRLLRTQGAPHISTSR